MSKYTIHLSHELECHPGDSELIDLVSSSFSEEPPCNYATNIPAQHYGILDLQKIPSSGSNVGEIVDKRLIVKALEICAKDKKFESRRITATFFGPKREVSEMASIVAFRPYSDGPIIVDTVRRPSCGQSYINYKYIGMCLRGIMTAILHRDEGTQLNEIWHFVSDPVCRKRGYFAQLQEKHVRKKDLPAWDVLCVKLAATNSLLDDATATRGPWIGILNSKTVMRYMQEAHALLSCSNMRVTHRDGSNIENVRLHFDKEIRDRDLLKVIKLIGDVRLSYSAGLHYRRSRFVSQS